MKSRSSSGRGYGMSIYISTEMSKVISSIEEFIRDRSSNNKYRSMSEFIAQAIKEKAKREIGQ